MLFVGLGIVAHILFVIYTTEKDIAAKLAKISPWYFLAIIALMSIPWLGYAFRVTMWSRFLGERISYSDALRIVITADVASALSPTAVGGAPFKAALLVKKGFSTGRVGFLLTWGVIEDILFYTSGFIFAVWFSSGIMDNLFGKITGFVKDNSNWFFWIFVFIISYIIVVKAKLLPEKFSFSALVPTRLKNSYLKLLVKTRQGYDEMRECFMMVLNAGKWRMLLGITILYVQWFAKFSVLVVILYALNITPDVLQVYARQWIIWITMLFIPTPGASGGAEASFLLIFGKSIPSDVVNLIVSLWRFFTYYLVLLSAVVVYQTLGFFTGKEISEIEIETPEVKQNSP